MKGIKVHPVTALIVMSLSVLAAASMGTAFTYQGRLLDFNEPANGFYDMAFVMFDMPEGPNTLGEAGAGNIEVIDGYFTVPLDFGADVYNGEKRWLELYIKPSDVNDPNAFIPVWPRQEITPAPYALYAANAARTGTPGYLAKFDANGIGNSAVFQKDSKIGIGTTDPQVKLSLGTDLAPKKLALWDGVGDFYGLGIDWGRIIFTAADDEKMTIRDTGKVGIGTPNPATLLEIEGPNDGFAIINTDQIGTNTYTGYRMDRDNTEKWLVGMGPLNDNLLIRRNAATNDMSIDASGNVGIGTTNPTKKLDVDWGDILVQGPQSASAPGHQGTVYLGTGHHYIRGEYGFGVKIGTYGVGDVIAVRELSGNVGIGTTSPAARLDVVGKIRISNSSGDPLVELGEGLDYAEGFDITETEKLPPGTVVSIDEDNPGKLKICSQPYDTKVAGIVAGAKGLGSGVRLGSGQFDADVALAGRVYCNADAAEFEIKTGDLLTTSETPGHAAKATDCEKARGAILGKAMEGLERGKKGQILVLVTLQ